MSGLNLLKRDYFSPCEVINGKVDIFSGRQRANFQYSSTFHSGENNYGFIFFFTGFTAVSFLVSHMLAFIIRRSWFPLASFVQPL